MVILFPMYTLEHKPRTFMKSSKAQRIMLRKISCWKIILVKVKFTYANTTLVKGSDNASKTSSLLRVSRDEVEPLRLRYRKLVVSKVSWYNRFQETSDRSGSPYFYRRKEKNPKIYDYN